MSIHSSRKVYRRFLALVWVTIQGWASEEKLFLAIQPLGKVSPVLVQQVKEGIQSSFRVEIRILSQQPLPESAWYPPRKRYRADRLLTFLTSQKPKDCHKILGLTHVDISCTKAPYEDWGIFGLGSLGGAPCVVSTFRLGAPGKLSKRDRLVQVVKHELGHTFGLDHCPTVGCLMEDCKGTIRTVDQSHGKPCPACERLLGSLLKKTNLKSQVPSATQKKTPSIGDD